jgi:protein-L-isoaspartate(D-aspartate) O-methyltransferase
MNNEKLLEQIKKQGVADRKILQAFTKVDRKKFLPKEQKAKAYQDRPIPIGYNQTISQPSLVASMTKKLDVGENDTILEIGTGSGYQAAILAEIVKQVYTIERVEELANRAKDTLAELGYDNVEVIIGDGSKGLPEYAPYDGIIVTAAAPEIPQTLVDQLKEGGKIVIPVGGKMTQSLKVCQKKDGELEIIEESYVRFVPLIGDEGWENH